MAVYRIYQDGKKINRIVADEDFAKTYCEENGYTFELEVLPTPEPGQEPTPEPSEIEVLRAQVNTLSVATSIAFVTLAEAGSIDDVTAGEHADLFTPWASPVTYKAGDIRRYDGQLYRCVQAHTSQADWTPDTAVSLWAKIADPADEWPEWSQPVGAHDAYQTGDKVSHNGQHWTSTVDGNVWEPGVYGWELAKEDES